MKKRMITAICTLSIAMVLLSACQNEAASVSYKDGTYIGKSSMDDRDAYGEVTLVIENHQLSTCKFVTWQADGSMKDEEYGKVNGEISNKDYYDKAQLAVDAIKTYAEQFEQVKKIENVDAISGATIAYNQFTEAVNDALKEAVQTDEK
ncbi:FMN-binding protein [Lachnospiraceae bacterium ZAX-1]